MKYSLNALYETVGVSKQAVYQAKQRKEIFDRELLEQVALADELKEVHPGCGVEKMYYTLKPAHIGRDIFCDLFLSMGYGVKRVKNYHRTTYSGGMRYPNLIEGLIVNRPFQVIQSDITYFKLHDEHYYLVFIIDVYTRLVVGYAVSDNLRTEANIKALKMAFQLMDYQPWGAIHHSDRGSHHYNQNRVHRAFRMQYTPMEFYQKLVNLPNQERPTVRIYTEGKVNFLRGLSPFEVYPRKEPLAHICPMDIVNEC